MLPRKYRLTRPRDFRRVQSRGRCRSDAMLVLCKHRNDSVDSRFGFSVSRRIGKAVVRNRTKRMIREAVRLRRGLIVPGWDVVFIARRGIIGTDYRAVERSVTRLLERAGLLATPDGGDDGME